MKKYHINYASGKYIKSQEYCSNSAKNFGFDEVISYSFNDIDDDFVETNKNILSQPRGAGYWIWKPYFIKKTLDKMEYGDILVYSDSGSYYQSSPMILVDILLNDPNGVLSFELKGLYERQYTKRDTFIHMGLDEPKYTDSSQREATFIWLVKNDFTIKIINEYLEYAQNEIVITDIPSKSENYPEFIDHRHDQSIWSLLCKKYDIEPHKLISQWGEGIKSDFPNDTYGQIAMHHRNPI
jgi:hypothetical protein